MSGRQSVVDEVAKFLEAFYTYFERMPAVTNQLKMEVYKPRYQVYCLESGFAEAGAFLDCVVFDEYGNHAIH